jgi:hypothetical protein
MSILLLALIMSLIPVVRDQDQSWKSKFLLARYITLVIFTFFPSRFLWSVSALRESACEFWFLVFISVFGRFLMKQPTDMRKSIFYALLTSSSLVGLFLIRWQTAILLSFTVIVLCWINVKNLRIQNSLLVTLAVIFSSTLGLVLSTPQTKADVSISRTINYSPNNSEGTTPAKENDGILEKVLRRDVESIKEPFAILSKVEEKSIVNAQGAQSAIKVNPCAVKTELLTRMKCNLLEIPSRLLLITLRPLPILDSGSNILELAAIENIIWFLMFILSIYLSIRTFQVFSMDPLFKLLSISTLFYLLSMSIYEGNLGTAFRHKTMILGPILLIIQVGIEYSLSRTKSKID